jgi:hypothetical protein
VLTKSLSKENTAMMISRILAAIAGLIVYFAAMTAIYSVAMG